MKCLNKNRINTCASPQTINSYLFQNLGVKEGALRKKKPTGHVPSRDYYFRGRGRMHRGKQGPEEQSR